MKEKITVYRDIYSKEPFPMTIGEALQRIKNGRSKDKVMAIRSAMDKERADNLKKNLPSVCFSGEFNGAREDANLKKHSGYLVLDFDECEDAVDKKQKLSTLPFIFACWLSPRGNGVKALVKIARPSDHRKHFAALQTYFKGELDKTGVNVARVCYESYDPDLYVNEKAEVWKTVEKDIVVEKREVTTDYSEIFSTMLKWVSNKGGAFVTGERNNFVFRVACLCCEYGIPEINALGLITGSFMTSSNGFSHRECESAVKSAYKRCAGRFATATLKNGVLVNKTTHIEVELEHPDSFYDKSVKVNDVIYAEDVKESALSIYRSGYESVKKWDIPILDRHFKRRKGELTVLTGIGNYGKSTFWKFLMLLRVVKFGEKFAVFGPEDNPAEQFYHDFVEIYLGCDCTPSNINRPTEGRYNAAYEFIGQHIFYVYPQSISPTPAYVKERFLELIIKENVDGVVIDPFNQMANDYASSGGRSDKYLETFLSDCIRFGQGNGVYFDIVAHPKQMRKDGANNYPMPDVFDLADGAMWNNKADNIVVYHRPNHQQNPNDPSCVVGFKKIRRQKIVGLKGEIEIVLDRPTRRYLFDGVDVMGVAIGEIKTQETIEFDSPKSVLKPNDSFIKSSPVSSQDARDLSPYEDDPLNPNSYK
jgi:hypothetical protein